MNPQTRGFALVIAAPSGAGKTTMAHALVERIPGLEFSISVTTRPRRPHERAGSDYHFVDEDDFARMVREGEFAEWAEVHGHRYGTPRRALSSAIESGRIVVLDIDVQGARQIRKHIEDSVLVFILPPSAEELHRRLAGRGSEADQERRRRLRNAREELPSAVDFDYVIVNDDFEAGVAALSEIAGAERRRVARMGTIRDVLAKLDGELKEILQED